MNIDTELSEWLTQRDGAGLRRVLTTVEARRGMEYRVNGRWYVSFCSNDYLGLADDDCTRQGARDALEQWGCGAGASRLVSGDLGIIRELETELAAWKQTEAALVYPSGYMANIGVISALAGPGDTVFIDRLAHASLVDGTRLSRARLRVFPHNDFERLDTLLGNVSARRTIVITESVFSMDGDTAPLRALSMVCKKHGALLMVDEAHALGVYGGGRGLVNAEGLSGKIDVLVGTLSKAIGSQGGFAAGSRQLCDYLVNTSRSFIYTTGINPAAAGAAIAALRCLKNDSTRIDKLWYNISRFRSQVSDLRIMGQGPICPVMTGTAQAACTRARLLAEEGYLAPAIRPPTVPEGGARMRVTLSALHSPEQIDRFARVLIDTANR